MKYFLEFVKKFNEIKLAKKLDKEQGTSIVFNRSQNEGEDFLDHIEYSISQAKIFIIEDSIKKLLTLTKVPKNNENV